MNLNSEYSIEIEDTDDTRPILIVPYMWIGDFVRGHTVVRVLKQRWPNRPVDLLTTSLCAPLVDYMPGVRSGIVWDLPRSRLAVAKQWRLAARLRRQLRHRADPAPHLEIGDRAGAGRHPGAGRLRRRGPIRADQPMALGRKGPAPLHRQERRAGAAGRRAAAAGMAGAAAPRAGRGSRAAGGRPTGWAPVPPWRWPRARSAPPSAGPITRRPRGFWPSTGSTSGWSAAPARRRWRRRSSPPAAARPRPHRHRSAQRHSGDGGGRRRDFERFRPDAYRGRDRHADHGHFRPHQPLSLGAAERSCGDGADQDRRAVPALPPPGLHR